MIAFAIPGKPFAKQRPRFSRATGRAFTPGQTVSFERQVGLIASQHVPEPLTGPVAIDIIAVFEPAASWPKKRRVHAAPGHLGRDVVGHDLHETVTLHGAFNAQDEGVCQIGSFHLPCLRIWPNMATWGNRNIITTC